MGAALCGLGVRLGTVGAHGLWGWVTPDLLAVFEADVRYHLIHGLAVVASRWSNGLISLAGWLFVAGILIFCGSLYVLSITGVWWLGAITPIGDLCLTVG